MRGLIVPVLAGLLAACASIAKENSMFTTDEFLHLGFLEGRWEGTGPDGKPFYEQYAFTRADEMRSTRFADATFAQPTDGSVVALDRGRVIATWGEFSWQASELVPGRACFTPIHAPGSFCWERLSDTSAQVTQRWTDEHGTAREYTVPLRRL